ncbi:MAG: hypothetical protein IKH28_06000 [Lachnospiraceae bacterium]|nr:hypothetical protein [Lachnospiraceae bacterium]
MRRIRVIILVLILAVFATSCLGKSCVASPVSSAPKKYEKHYGLEEEKWNGLPNIYVRGNYREKSNVVPITTEKATDEYACYNPLPRYVSEGDDGAIIQLNNSVYRLTNGEPVLLFKADPYILSLVCATKDYVVYLCDSGSKDHDYGHYQNSVWRYDLGTKTTTQIFDRDFYLPSSFGLQIVDEYLMIYCDDTLYIANLKENQEIVFKDYSFLEVDDVQSKLPEGFEVSEITTWDYDDEHHIVKEMTKDGNPTILSENAYEGPDREESLPMDNRYRLVKNCSYYDGNYYVTYTEPQHVQYSRVSAVYGTSERVNTDQWNKDYIEIIRGPEYSKAEPYYNEFHVRIIGFLPETNEVIQYQFNDKSLVVKDLDDNTVTTIEKILQKSKTIQFEWIDTRLYWFYLDEMETGGTETDRYGGCYDFGEPSPLAHFGWR